MSTGLFVATKPGRSGETSPGWRRRAAGCSRASRARTFGITAAGVWTYLLDNEAAQALAGGEVVTEEFVVTATTEDGEEVTEGFGRLTAPDALEFDDHRALLARDDVDAVVVATPNHTHRAVMEDVFASGKHVLCEKPLCTTVEDARWVAEAADAHVGGEGRPARPRQVAPERLAHADERAAEHDDAMRWTIIGEDRWREALLERQDDGVAKGRQADDQERQRGGRDDAPAGARQPCGALTSKLPRRRPSATCNSRPAIRARILVV